MPALFSLSEMMILGEVETGTNLDAWGMSALQASGCPCTRMTFPWSWHLLAGRSQLALGASSSPDLNLQIALMLAEMGLPAVLAKSVLAAAVQDFVEDVAPTDPVDWWSLSRAATTVARERVEDYVAAAASIDGVLVPDEIDDEEPLTCCSDARPRRFSSRAWSSVALLAQEPPAAVTGSRFNPPTPPRSSAVRPSSKPASSRQRASPP